jgi:hypothetical protein
MPYIGQDFGDVDVGQIVTFSIDFRLELAAGETVTSTTWEIAVEHGSDPKVSTRLVDGAEMNGTVSLQQAGPFLANTVYTLIATCETNHGNKPMLWAYVKCKEPRAKNKLLARN